MAEDIIGFEDLFDFNSDTPLEKGLEGIARLEKAYESFVKRIQASSGVTRQALNSLAGELDDAAKKIGNVNVATQDGRRQAASMAAQIDKQAKAYSNLKIKLKEQQAESRAMAKELRDIRKAYDLLDRAKARSAADAKKIATKQAESEISIAKKSAESQIAIEERLKKARIAIKESVGKINASLRKKQALDEYNDAREQARKLAKLDEQQAAAKRKRGGTGSINDISAQRDAALAAYNRLGSKTPDFVRQQQLQMINRLTRSLQDAQAAMLIARKGAIVARDSYAGLVQENARLVKQLREMPGAFNTATGEINRHNQAAVKLQEQYRRNTEALKTFDRNLGLNGRNVGNYGGTLGVVGNSMKQFALGLAGQFAGMFALAEATRIAFTSNLALADSQTAVQKTVGLTKQEVDDLAEAFKQVDSRTNLAGLFDIAKVGGQFGVAKKDIDEFTESADKAAVALSDEFKGGVEEIATELYTLRGLFEDTRELSPAEAMERIGSAINSLGASGAATGPVIAEFAKRIGQLGEMGPTIGDALGLGAALQELGFSAEIASGGYTNLVIQLDKNSAKISKAFGMTEKAFRGMLESDPTETILMMAEAMKDVENSTAILSGFGIQSQESIKVFNSMGESADRVREQLKKSNDELDRGTSLQKEFELANNNAAASWEKLKRSLIEPFTSGAIGKGIQSLIEQVNRLIGAFTSVDSVVGTSVQTHVLQGEAYARQAYELGTLVSQYEHLEKQAALTEEQESELAKTLVRINMLVGEGTMLLDKESGTYTMNTEKVLEKKAALEELAKTSRDANQGVVDELYEEEKKLREQVSIIKAERDILKSQEVKKPDLTGNGAANLILDIIGDPRYAEYENYIARLNKKEQELEETGEQLNDLLLKRRAIMTTLATSINKATDAHKEMQPWLKQTYDKMLGIQKAPKAENPFGEINPEDVEKSADATSKAADEMKRLADLAAEAKHQLELLRQQQRVTSAENRLEDTEDILPNDRLAVEERLIAIERLYDEEAELARKNAEEKLRHNEAGADGIALINAQLQVELEALDRERLQRQEETLAKMGDNERKYAKIAFDAWSKNTKAERKLREEHSKWLLEKAEHEAQANSTYDRDVEIAEWEKYEKKKEYAEAAFEVVTELSNAAFEIAINNMSAEHERMMYMRDQELAAAGNNEELKFEIEKRYRDKELKLRQKMARAQKQQAMFDIALNTAAAVMRALASFPGWPLNAPFVIAAGAMGAAQLAVVASKPIPQFYRGVKDSPEGYARVAETGPELAISPSGEIVKYEKPQTVYLEKGTEVKTATQTNSIIRLTERVYSNNHTESLVNSFDASQRLIMKQDGISDGIKMLSKDFRSYAGRIEGAISRQDRLIVNADGSVKRSNGRVWSEYVNWKYKR